LQTIKTILIMELKFPRN